MKRFSQHGMAPFGNFRIKILPKVIELVETLTRSSSGIFRKCRATALTSGCDIMKIRLEVQPRVHSMLGQVV